MIKDIYEIYIDVSNDDSLTRVCFRFRGITRAQAHLRVSELCKLANIRYDHAYTLKGYEEVKE